MPKTIGTTEVFTTQEAATIVGKHIQTIHNMISDNRIHATKVGKVYLIAREDLLDYMDTLNLPEMMIEYRLGIKSPKTGKTIHKNPKA